MVGDIRPDEVICHTANSGQNWKSHFLTRCPGLKSLPDA